MYLLTFILSETIWLAYHTASVMNFNLHFNFWSKKAIWRAPSLTSLQVPFEIISLCFHNYFIVSYVDIKEKKKTLLCVQLIRWTTVYRIFLFWQIQSKDENIFQGRRICSFSNYKWVRALNPLTSQGGMEPLLALVEWHEFWFEAHFNSQKGVFLYQSVTFSAKMSNKEGTDVRWITSTEVSNPYSEDNA